MNPTDPRRPDESRDDKPEALDPDDRSGKPQKDELRRDPPGETRKGPGSASADLGMTGDGDN